MVPSFIQHFSPSEYHFQYWSQTGRKMLETPECSEARLGREGAGLAPLSHTLGLTLNLESRLPIRAPYYISLPTWVCQESAAAGWASKKYSYPLNGDLFAPLPEIWQGGSIEWRYIRISSWLGGESPSPRSMFPTETNRNKFKKK